MAVDLGGGAQTEEQLVIRLLVPQVLGYELAACALIGVLEFSLPLHRIGVLFEVRHAYTEVVQLVRELRSEAVDKCLVRCGHIALCHRLCRHLRHLIARDVAVAAIRAVAVALDHTVGGELRHSVIRPVVARHIAERICRRERRRCCADDECRTECGYQSFLHGEFLLLKSAGGGMPVFPMRCIVSAALSPTLITEIKSYYTGGEKKCQAEISEKVNERLKNMRCDSYQ